jgi:hypothetical protein
MCIYLSWACSKQYSFVRLSVDRCESFSGYHSGKVEDAQFWYFGFIDNYLKLLVYGSARYGPPFRPFCTSTALRRGMTTESRFGLLPIQKHLCRLGTRGAQFHGVIVICRVHGLWCAAQELCSSVWVATPCRSQVILVLMAFVLRSLGPPQALVFMLLGHQLRPQPSPMHLFRTPVEEAVCHGSDHLSPALAC